MLNFLKKCLRPSMRRPFEMANVQDVDYCYRLLLKRRPDKESRRRWTQVVRQNGLSLQQLTNQFLQSDEFKALQQRDPELAGVRAADAAAADLVLVRTADFAIYVRLNDFAVGHYLARWNTYEPHVTRAITAFLKPGSIFLDIGANIGYYTLLAAAHVGPQGRVIALEPNPTNVASLRASVAYNQFANVELYPYAAADRERILRICPDGENSTSHVAEAADPAYRRARNGHLAVAVVLDDLLQDRERIDVLKIDIDGGEPQALAGMRQLIARRHPVIFCEFAPPLLERIAQCSPVAFLDQIAAPGYSISIIDHRTGAIRATKSKQEVLDAYATCGITHIDLLAEPKQPRP